MTSDDGIWGVGSRDNWAAGAPRLGFIAVNFTFTMGTAGVVAIARLEVLLIS